MRKTGFILALMLAASPAKAQENEAIEDVIASQLEAFNERDVEDAWQYASPMIKQMFGNSGNLGAMVQQGYPMVWTNTITEFLELTPMQGRQLQRVLISDDNGVPHILEYLMIKTAQGWRIDGVSILPAPEVGA